MSDSGSDVQSVHSSQDDWETIEGFWNENEDSEVIIRGSPTSPLRIVSIMASKDCEPGRFNYRWLENCVYLVGKCFMSMINKNASMIAVSVDPLNTRESKGYAGPKIKLGAFDDKLVSKAMLQQYQSDLKWGKEKLDKLRPSGPGQETSAPSKIQSKQRLFFFISFYGHFNHFFDPVHSLLVHFLLYNLRFHNISN